MTYLTEAGRNRPWTPGALNALKTASKRGTSVTSLSRMLRRTETALRQKARAQGWPLGPRQRGVPAPGKKRKSRAR